MKTTLLICGTKQECEHYLMQFVSTPSNEDKEFRVSRDEAVSDLFKERVMAIIPAESDKLRGLDFEDIFVFGSAREKAGFEDAFDLANAQLARP